jgi:serine/threonine-protein phosphatase Stp1
MAKVDAWRYRSVARTNAGLIRELNEDSLVDRPDAGLWAVADGMGGLHRGDRASGLIREALERLAPAADLDGYVAAVRDGLAAVDARLRADEAVSGTSGSAVVALLAAGGRFACVWAGDSRLYRWRAGRLERLTRDHSLVQDLVASGTLSDEDAHGHPLANRITRAVGVGARLELDVARGVLAPGDRYLLSSDGLHGVVTDAAIAELMQSPDLDAAADGLIAAVLRAGAPDNVSVVLVSVEPAR